MNRNTTIRDRHRREIAKNQPDCGICGEPIDYTLKHPDPRSYVVDHILPIKHGGLDELFMPDGTPQKQAAHRECNRAKSDTLSEDQTPAARTFVTTLTW